MPDDRAAAIAPQIPGLRLFARALLRGDRARTDDLVQDSLVRALAHWHRLRSEGNLRGWLYTIIRNHFLTEKRLQRRRNAHVRLSDTGEAELPQIDGGQYAALEYRDFLHAFQELPENQRLVLFLIGVEGLSYQEAARTLGVPIGTVMSRLSRARERLRQDMDGENHAGGCRAVEWGKEDPALKPRLGRRRAPMPVSCRLPDSRNRAVFAVLRKFQPRNKTRPRESS